LISSLIIIAGIYFGNKAYKKYSVVEADIDKVEVKKGEISVMF